tara:strand:+ start:176 stop:679 length:504 start_codon:yes stop_codon:yes gene_type:complete
MAHFAELDDNNVVIRVVVVGNDVTTASGPLGDNDMHVDGETWCVNFFKGGTWKQTSYNNNFRKSYCGAGHIYDAAKDKFLLPQPHASWALDVNDDWQAPVTYPTVINYQKTYSAEDDLPEGISIGDVEQRPYFILWDEAGTQWTSKDSEDPQNIFNWDTSTLAWVAE